jgi:hypothetical protein
MAHCEARWGNSVRFKSVLRVMLNRFTKPSGVVLAIFAIASVALTIHVYRDEAVLRRIANLALGYVLNNYGQITYSVWSKRADCPQDMGSVLVLVPMGQSNAANSVSGLYNDLRDERILNFFSGSCFIARDPLIGSGGIHGSIWSLLALAVLRESRWQNIVIAPMAVGSSAVALWVPGGWLFPMAKMRIDELSRAGFRNVAFLWHQGEIDRLDQGGNEADYRAHLRKVIALTKSAYPKSAFFVSIATKCGIESEPDPAIQQAQLSMINPSEGVYAGPNTDLLGNAFRHDGCHFNAEGARAEVLLWLDALKASGLLSNEKRASGVSD